MSVFVFFLSVDRVLVLRWETSPSSSEPALTGGAPLACSCPRRRSGFSERASRCALSHPREQVRHRLSTRSVHSSCYKLTATVCPNLSRECHGLDPALHRRRLPLHRSGERGARPAGGVQSEVAKLRARPSLKLHARVPKRGLCGVPRQSLLQILLIFSGVAVMALLSSVVE